MYSFETALTELDDVVALKTFKNWANKVEQLTDARFERAFAKNSAGKKYSYKVFTSQDIENFRRLIELRERHVPLKEAIERVFMSENGKQILVNEKEFIEMKSDMKSLIALTKDLLEKNPD